MKNRDKGTSSAVWNPSSIKYPIHTYSNDYIWLFLKWITLSIKMLENPDENLIIKKQWNYLAL